MKFFPVAVCVIVAVEAIACRGAAAQTSVCSVIKSADDRLACYDKAAATTDNNLDKAKTTVFDPPTNRRSVADMLADENAKLSARLKTICRGC